LQKQNKQLETQIPTIMNVTFANNQVQRQAELFKALLNDGGKYGSVVISARTSQALEPKKNGCPFGKADEITKLTTYEADVNGNYAKIVNARREKIANQPNYVPTKNWHKKIYDTTNGCIVAKRSEVENGLPITQVYVMIALKPKAMKSTDYQIKGRKADEDEVALIKQWRKRNVKEDTAKTQGVAVEDAYIIRTIGANGITEVKANGQVVGF
jgi:hypothetical protein